MVKQEFKIGDTAHMSANYFTKIESDGTFKRVRLQMDEEVKILGIIRTDPNKTSGFMYLTNKGEIPQEKLFSKALWKKYSDLQTKLNSKNKNE